MEHLFLCWSAYDTSDGVEEMAGDRDNISAMIEMNNQGLNIIVGGGATADDGMYGCWPGWLFVFGEEN